MPDRRVSVGIDADVSGFQRGLATAAVEAKAFSRELQSADSRLAGFIQTGLALAPALVPLGAAAVPAIAGLTLEFGLAASAAGVAVLAFHGISDAVKALDAARLNPTTQNLSKLQEQLDKLGPAGEQFVYAIDDLKPKLQELQDLAQAGLLPGVTDGLESLLDQLPQVGEVISTIATTLGDLSREAGQSLGGPDFEHFFTYLETTARPVLLEMGHTFGNFLAGFSNTVIAFDPLSRSFSRGLLDLSREFKDATANLGDSEGFQKFLAYVEKSGPLALDALESIGNAFLQLVEAAAPVGTAVLPIISELADALANIADSPLGPVLIGTAAAIGTLGRALAVLKAVGLSGGGGSGLIGRILDPGKIKAGALAFASVPTAADRARLSIVELEAAEQKRNATIRAGAGQLGKTTALVGGLGLAASGLADNIGLSHTASLALLGTLAGPEGTAVGAFAGALLDAGAAADKAAASQAAYEKVLKGDNAAPIQSKINDLKAQGASKYGTTPPRALVGRGAGYTQVQQNASNADLLSRSYSALDRISELNGTKVGAVNAKLLGDGLILTAHGAELATESTDKFTAELGVLNTALAARSSLTSYRSALLDIGDALKKNGPTLDLNTRAGLANRQSLESLASTALARAKDLEDAGKRTQSIKFLSNAKKDLIDAAVAFGVPRKQARALANQLLDLGAVRAKPTVTLVDNATGKISGIKAALASLKPVSVYVGLSGPGAGKIHSANGNIFGAYANGDIANGHQPELAGPGLTRIWREPETQGEAYIPLANDSRRPRAMSIVEQTAGMFGGQVDWLGTGSVLKLAAGGFVAMPDLGLTEQELVA